MRGPEACHICGLAADTACESCRQATCGGHYHYSAGICLSCMVPTVRLIGVAPTAGNSLGAVGRGLMWTRAAIAGLTGVDIDERPVLIGQLESLLVDHSTLRENCSYPILGEAPSRGDWTVLLTCLQASIWILLIDRRRTFQAAGRHYLRHDFGHLAASVDDATRGNGHLQALVGWAVKENRLADLL